MKRSLFAAILLILGFQSLTPCRAQSSEDVVYFKNGAVLHGQILEEDPALWLKIRTPDGAVRAYSINDVEKVLKSELPGLGPADAPGPAPSANGPVVNHDPTTAFLFSFLVPGLGCYLNGGDDTKIGLLCDGLYVGGIVLMLTAGTSTTQEDLGYGQTIDTVNTTPFLWVGCGVALGGWILGMIDAPAYAANHQPHPNRYGDLLNLQGPGYEVGLGLSPVATLDGAALSVPSPSLAFRF
ncbi:MAG TPA: hypothetical protein VHE12_11060 [bacterium]|nr:hypothetical protein [bacterium]